MDWKITIWKGILGALTFAAAYLASNPSIIMNLIPANILNLTVGGIISGAIVFVSNWLKHINDA